MLLAVCLSSSGYTWEFGEHSTHQKAREAHGYSSNSYILPHTLRSKNRHIFTIVLFFLQFKRGTFSLQYRRPPPPPPPYRQLLTTLVGTACGFVIVREKKSFEALKSSQGHFRLFKRYYFIFEKDSARNRNFPRSSLFRKIIFSVTWLTNVYLLCLVG